MDAEFFHAMKRYVGFDDQDVVNLGKLAEVLTPAFPNVVERFYEEIYRDPLAIAVFTGGHGQLQRLKSTMHQWLTESVGGQYDLTHYERQSEIGRVHVRVALPQYLMVAGISVIRTELLRYLVPIQLPDKDALRVSLNKALDLNLAIMIETYRSASEERIRLAERNQMEEKLSEAKHLAHLGKLAASLAHEIRNPLAGISGAIQILGQGMTPGDERHEVIGEVLRQIDRLDAAVNDLLIYSRPKPPVPEERNLEDILSRVLALLEESPPLRKVKVCIHGTETRPRAHVDEGQMEQVLCNLILNACHASHRGGRLDIFLGSRGETCEIRIQDYGTGMPQEVLERAFEPFFTTKAKGTGLGLSICKKIVEAHGGYIQLASQVGQGTTATVRLPTAPSFVSTDRGRA